MPEDKDIREEILHNLVISDKYFKDDVYSKELIFDAMDERARRMCMDLLQWMAENEIEIDISSSLAQNTGEQIFYYKGQWITKEELFNNFL